jgi:predicted PurR-regulated permease PerM
MTSDLEENRKHPQPDGKRSPTAPEITSWCITAAALVAVLWLHLLPALLAGLLVHQLVHVMAPLLQRLVPRPRARVVAVAILSALIVGLMTAAILGTVAFFRSDAGSLPVLLQKMADILDGARATFPAWITEWLPASANDMREASTRWLREHASEVRLAGAEAGRAFAHIVIGMIIGAMISLREARPTRSQQPLARALIERALRVGDAFRRVVFAQVRISAINTILTTIYLAIVLPAFGVHLPLTKALIGVTFLAGLLPVIGNLISNTVIVIVSLAHSPYLAATSLAFLVVIHKLEYFLNAHIIGSQIRSSAWELLLAMLAMEAAFGLPGVVAAPIYYAYLKRELTDTKLV